jgi:membrane protease YdiL (CAAX protease family)
MLGILVILIVSWLLLYIAERRSILALGFLPLGKRLRQFAVGFSITAILCAGDQLLEALLRSSDWTWHGHFKTAVTMLWWDIKSVLTEELIFRGALLFILIRRIGSAKAILISSVAFGAYHWFSLGILGSVVPMVVIFIGSGLMGYAWALAFDKTGSIFMPFGFHLGWNFTLNTVFSKGPLGEGLVELSGGEAISDFYSLVGLWLIPILLVLMVKYWLPSQRKLK